MKYSDCYMLLLFRFDKSAPKFASVHDYPNKCHFPITNSHIPVCGIQNESIFYCCEIYDEKPSDLKQSSLTHRSLTQKSRQTQLGSKEPCFHFDLSFCYSCNSSLKGSLDVDTLKTSALQLGLVEGEINNLLRGIHQVQSPHLGASGESARVEEDGCLKQKDVSAEDICPICQEVLLEKKLPVTFC
ncbi:hypothetical protein STEG23_034278, partial [Scotinomys teguina]